MRKYGHTQRRYSAIILSAMLCGSFLSGCGESAATPVTPSETVIAQDSDTTVTVGSIRCDALTRELTLTDADLTELQQILPLLPQLAVMIIVGMGSYVALSALFRVESFGYLLKMLRPILNKLKK